MRPRAGTVITADFQSGGVGQYGRSWHGTRGQNIGLTLILHPTLKSTEQFAISACTALATRDAVEQSGGQDATIKWPNDIYIGDKKVAGILIQNTLSSSRIIYSVVGIGINVNENDFPDWIPNPVSLMQITGGKLSVGKIQSTLFAALEQWLQRLSKIPVSAIVQELNKHLYRLHEVCRFRSMNDNSEFEAVISGVAESGKLILERHNGQSLYNFNQIKHLI